MPVVVGIRFKDSGKTYFFDPNELEELGQGDHVIVETVRGLELAKVSSAPHTVPDEEIVGELKPVIRRAEAADFERMRLLSARHDEVMARCAEKIAEHTLPMRLVKAEYSFDGSRLTFYFTSEKRVDFRMLVRDLARTFKTRIELRQIGPRDEAKLLGGIGPCGRLLCCATFLPDYARVSIKMAKDQDLPLNPTKISGVCGRLLCCLSYEHDQYLKIKAELPRKGAWVQTPDGPGEVIAVNVLRETVMVELEGGLHEEFSPQQLGEATQRVSAVARARVEEGVAPFSRSGDGPPRRERNTPPEQPRREPKHTGERRLLRDEVVDDEVLEALAMLEEGITDRDAPWDAESQPAAPRAEGAPPARPTDQRRGSGGPPQRRPNPPAGQESPQSARPAQQPGPPRQPRRDRPQPIRPERRPDENRQETRPERRPDEPRHETRNELRPERRPDEPRPSSLPPAPDPAGSPRAPRHRRKRERREGEE